jgi:hypothetical protein
MSQDQTPAADALDEAIKVTVEAGVVVVFGPRSGSVTLTPEAAARSGERLIEAAQEAGRCASGEARAPKPPFPPAELVSPHGAA